MIDIDQFQRRVSHVARGCPTAVLRDAILQAAEDFCERTWLWKEQVSLETVAGQTEYTVHPPRGAEVLAVAGVTMDGDTGHFTTPDRSTIRLWSEPEAGREIVAQAVLKPSRTAKALPDFLWTQWQDAISVGARYKLLDMGGSEWFNPQLSDKYRLEFERLWVPRARVEVAHRHGRPLSVRKRRFI